MKTKNKFLKTTYSVLITNKTPSLDGGFGKVLFSYSRMKPIKNNIVFEIATYRYELIH